MPAERRERREMEGVEERRKANEQTSGSGEQSARLIKLEKAAGLPPARWLKAGVWTPRMLKALKSGVRGGKWFSLWDKVYSRRNLAASWQQVESNKGAPGIDGVTVSQFAADASAQLGRLEKQLHDGAYRPQPVRRVMIPKPGSGHKRPLGIPTVRDRVVQTAALNVLEPIFEHAFADASYGFRPGRGCKDALRRVDELLASGHTHVVDADIQGYFDNIPHERLMARVRERVSDGRMLELIESYLKADILADMERWTPEQGTPQGAIISPLLANIYLDPLDHLMEMSGMQMVRYADDFVILCRTSEQAQTALRRIGDWMEANGLTLHPDKTRIADAARESFDFLGYRFDRGRKWPRSKSRKKLRENIKAKTHRNNGNSMAFIIKEVNQTLRGWFGYFKHSAAGAMIETDGYVRARLRSILRKRAGGTGRSRGHDHQRWPNAYFNNAGLLSLAAARAQLLQSSRR
jgi:RNA-directed DNA polymerase